MSTKKLAIVICDHNFVYNDLKIGFNFILWQLGRLLNNFIIKELAICKFILFFPKNADLN